MARAKSKFEHITLIHGKGEGTQQTVLPLQTVLAKNFPKLFFNCPLLLHSRSEASTHDSLEWLERFAPFVQSKSLLIGVYTGGFLAAKFQELHPALDVHVIAIAAPTSVDGIKLEDNVPNRVAFCQGCQDWKDLTPDAYDVPWLTHDINASKHRLGYLISCYMLGKDLKKHVEELFPPGI